MLLDVVKEVEIGKIYTGTVVKVKDFGCSVELWTGCEGLVKIYQLDEKHIEKLFDIISEED